MTVRGTSGYPTVDQRANGVLARQKAATAEVERKAARRVAAESSDALECAEFLSMLGLDATMGKREKAA